MENYSNEWKQQATLTVVGFVAKVDTRFMEKSGKYLHKISVATNYNKNVGTKEAPEWEKVRTEWTNCNVWSEDDDLFVSKGDCIKITGKKETRTYEKDGATEYAVELISFEAPEIKP